MPETGQNTARRICVLGVGNILLVDEGFGVRAMEYLRDHYVWPENVEFVDGGTLGLALMPLLMDHDVIVGLDIVRGQGKPGTIYLLENEDMRKALSFHDSTHDTDFVDLLETCSLLGSRPEAFVIGLEPYNFRTMDINLTPEAQGRLEEFCEKAAREMLRRHLIPAIVRKETADRRPQD